MIFFKRPSFSTALFFGFALATATGAHAFHQDIDVTAAGTQLQTGFCSRPESGCDIVGTEQLGLPEGTLPTDYETGRDIYVAQLFSLLGMTASDNPGFQAYPGDLAGGELIRYQALGQLRYWNPEQQHWGIAPADVRIRLAGGIDLAADQQCGLLLCPPKATEGYTLYTSQGIEGMASLIVGEARQDGSFHSHLDWFLESATSIPGGPAGAYLVEMQMYSELRPEPSAPFFILFSHDLSDEQFQSALAKLVLPEIDKARVDSLFDWAEASFPDLFPHRADSFESSGYYARCYDNGSCVGAKDDSVFAIGGEFGADVIRVDSLTNLFDAAGL